MNGVFDVVGQGFILSYSTLVVPLALVIVCGAASIGDTKTLGTIGVKTLTSICARLRSLLLSLYAWATCSIPGSASTSSSFW